MGVSGFMVLLWSLADALLITYDIGLLVRGW